MRCYRRDSEPRGAGGTSGTSCRQPVKNLLADASFSHVPSLISYLCYNHIAYASEALVSVVAFKDVQAIETYASFAQLLRLARLPDSLVLTGFQPHRCSPRCVDHARSSWRRQTSAPSCGPGGLRALYADSGAAVASVEGTDRRGQDRTSVSDVPSLAVYYTTGFFATPPQECDCSDAFFLSYDAAASLAVEVVRELLEYLWRPPSAQFLRLRVELLSISGYVAEPC
jgi:hypothetical protein